MGLIAGVLKTCIILASLYLPSDHPQLSQVVAIAAIESGCKAKAVSHAGARGVMQIMPSTGKWLWEYCEEKGVWDPKVLFDPALNFRLAICYLDHLAGLYGGDIWQMLAHYNGGSRAAAKVKSGGPLTCETANYLVRYRRYLEVLNEMDSNSRRSLVGLKPESGRGESRPSLENL